MRINWGVRLRSPQFWTGIVGVVGGFVVGLLALLGVDVSGQASAWEQALTALVGAVFGVLGVAGVVADPTTQGMSDSERAMTYEQPKPRGE